MRKVYLLYLQDNLMGIYTTQKQCQFYLKQLKAARKMWATMYNKYNLYVIVKPLNHIPTIMDEDGNILEIIEYKSK
jgi:hypothetical protein